MYHTKYSSFTIWGRREKETSTLCFNCFTCCAFQMLLRDIAITYSMDLIPLLFSQCSDSVLPNKHKLWRNNEGSQHSRHLWMNFRKERWRLLCWGFFSVACLCLNTGTKPEYVFIFMSRHDSKQEKKMITWNYYRSKSQFSSGLH